MNHVLSTFHLRQKVENPCQINDEKTGREAIEIEEQTVDSFQEWKVRSTQKQENNKKWRYM